MAKELVYAYGHYRLKIHYNGNGFAQVTMSDIAQMKYPLLWSCGMTYEQANESLETFRNKGYFDMPD